MLHYNILFNIFGINQIKNKKCRFFNDQMNCLWDSPSVGHRRSLPLFGTVPVIWCGPTGWRGRSNSFPGPIGFRPETDFSSPARGWRRTACPGNRNRNTRKTCRSVQSTCPSGRPDTSPARRLSNWWRSTCPFPWTWAVQTRKHASS